MSTRVCKDNINPWSSSMPHELMDSSSDGYIVMAVRLGRWHPEYTQMGVSKNRGTPKWMVYNGKPYENG